MVFMRRDSLRAQSAPWTAAEWTWADAGMRGCMVRHVIPNTTASTSAGTTTHTISIVGRVRGRMDEGRDELCALSAEVSRMRSTERTIATWASTQLATAIQKIASKTESNIGSKGGARTA